MISTQKFLKEERTKYDNLFNEVGIIWAFSDKQFTEQAQKDTKYSSIGNGGYIPSANVDAYLTGLKQIDLWAKNTKKNDEEIILYELNNYECFYIGDIEEALPRLKELGYTLNEAKKVFKKKEKNKNLP